MDLLNPTEIKALLNRHNLWAKKRFGQNFLTNGAVLDSIIETAEITPEDYIVEVGPGLGVLTQKLAENAKKVTSIEIDGTLLPVLSETLNPYKNIEILNQDALNYRTPNEAYKVVANIPYYITSPLINHFLQAENKPETITILTQKEVAEKACQIEPDMSVLSLQINLFGDPKLVKKVSAQSFFPAPKVDSAILHIIVRKNPPGKAQEILKLAKRGFSQKRKKLSNTLPDLREKLLELGLADQRPERLSIRDWENLLK